MRGSEMTPIAYLQHAPHRQVVGGLPRSDRR
jgi:hypothetical protein